MFSGIVKLVVFVHFVEFLKKASSLIAFEFKCFRIVIMLVMLKWLY